MALNQREKKLMIFLGGAVFLGANLFGWSELLQRETAAGVKKTQLQGSIKKSESLKQLIPLANQRGEQMAQWLKRYPDLDTRDTYLSNFVIKTAADLGLTLAKNQPMESEGLRRGANEAEPDFIKTGYQGEVSGDWKKVIEFAHLMEDTTEFRWLKVGDFKIRAKESQDSASGDLALNFQVQKWWHPDSEELLASDGAAPAEAEPAKTTADAIGAPKDTEQAPEPPVPSSVAETATATATATAAAAPAAPAPEN